MKAPVYYDAYSGLVVAADSSLLDVFHPLVSSCGPEAQILIPRLPGVVSHLLDLVLGPLTSLDTFLFSGQQVLRQFLERGE